MSGYPAFAPLDFQSAEVALLYATRPPSRIEHETVRTLTDDGHGDTVRIIRSEQGDLIAKTGSRAFHEAFVGICGIERLQNRLANFARVRGYDPVKNAVYYDYVRGKSLSEFVLVCSLADYKAVLLQLFLALIYANETIGFVHSDLHPENVIVSEIPVEPNRLQRELIRIYQPVIIDYGTVTVRLNGKIFGLADPSTCWIQDVELLLSSTDSMDIDEIDLIVEYNKNLTSTADRRVIEAMKEIHGGSDEIDIVLKLRAMHPDNPAKVRLNAELRKLLNGVKFSEFIERVLPILSSEKLGLENGTTE